jgi:ATP-dependent RNA helicase DeaD
MAARGLDVPDTSHVIMFDMPPTAESYLHRAGRTGRMGRPGVVVTLASKQEVFVVERLGNALSVAIAPVSGGH